MVRRIVVVIFLTVVRGELLPSFDLQQPFGAYLADERITVTDCPLRNYKWGGSTLTSAAALAEVYYTEFPYLAVLGTLQSDNVTLWKCSGALISRNYVLTSAECANNALDVARLGDFSLLDTTDDKFVQEFKIDLVIFHHSVALLQLNASIVPHPTVVPACLWTKPEFKFETLKSGTWTKKNLSLRGITETRIVCADRNPYTFCSNHTLEPEDLGRISEFHLYAQHKLIPFLLGLALTEQKVYAKLSSYVSWIEQTVGESFRPIDCALRHIEHRQYDPEYFTDNNFSYSRRNSNESSAFIGIVPRTFVVTLSPKNHKVRIVDDLSNEGLECSGSVIDKDFVLTTASCIKLFPNGPNTVITGWQDVIGVEKVHVHPEHKLIYKDIALVQLSRAVVFNESAQFACPWPLDITPSRLNSYGIGPQSLNVYGKDSRIVDLSIKSNVVNTTDCNSQLQAVSHWPVQMVTDDEICVGNPQHLVPGSCKMKLGSPLSRAAFYHNKYFPFLFGLGTFGEDCGFGSTPVVGTKVAAHIEWIDSIVFPDRKAVPVSELANITQTCYDQYADYRHNVTKYTNDINSQDFDTFSSSLVLIGGGTSNWTCDGAIVHQEFVLSTASCAKNASRIRTGVNLNHTDQQTLDVKEVFFHPEGNLALMRTMPAIFSLSVAPACVWFNSTHLPFFLSKPVWDFQTEMTTNIQMHSIPHEVCHGIEKSSHFCAGYQFPVTCKWNNNKVLNATLCSKTNCASGSGEIVMSFEPTSINKLVPVLVGLSAATNNCDLDQPVRFTRLSLYKDWIEDILHSV